MSGLKCTDISISETRQADLDRAVGAAMESIRQSVRDAIDAYEHRRLDKRRGAISALAARQRSTLDGLQRLPQSRETAGMIARCRAQILTSEAAATATATQADGIESIQRSIGHEIRVIQAQIAEAQVTAELDRMRLRIRTILDFLKGVDRTVHERFDAGGLTTIVSACRAVSLMVEARNANEAQSALLYLQQQVQNHVTIVEQRHAQWQRRRDEATAAIDIAKAKLDVYQNALQDQHEPACMRTIRVYVAEAGASLKAERFDHAERLAGMICSDLDKLNAMLREQAAVRLKSRAVVDAFAAAVVQMGGVLVKETEEIGRIVCEFKHCFRQGIQIAVAPAGNVSFLLPGYPNEAYLEDGRQVSECGARAELERLNSSLKPTGIQMTEVQWKNKPRRPREKALARTTTQRAQQTRERSK